MLQRNMSCPSGGGRYPTHKAMKLGMHNMLPNQMGVAYMGWSLSRPWKHRVSLHEELSLTLGSKCPWLSFLHSPVSQPTVRAYSQLADKETYA